MSLKYKLEGLHYVHAYNGDKKVWTLFVNREGGEAMIETLDEDNNGDLHIYLQGSEIPTGSLKEMKWNNSAMEWASVILNYINNRVVASSIAPGGSIIKFDYPNDIVVWVHLPKPRPYSFFTLDKKFHREVENYEGLLPFVKVYTTN